MTENDNDEIFLNACKNGDLQKVQALMDADEINDDDVIHDGLCQAAAVGNIELMQVFLDHGHGEFINDFDHSTTPLHEAIRNGQEDMVEFLIAKGATVDYYLDCHGFIEKDDIIEDTPLNLAIEKGFLSIVEILVENDAEVNGYTDIEAKPKVPFCKAMELGNKEIAEYLIENGADCSCERGCVKEAIDKGSIDEVKFLIENDVEAEYHDLHHAIKHHHEEIAEYLLEDWTYPGVECIFEAIEQSEHIFKLLMEKFHEKINVVGGTNLQTALHKAVIKGNYSMVKFLIEKGADTKKQDKNKKTPFDIAYEMKAEENILRLFDEKCPSGRIQMIIEKLKASYKKGSIILKNFNRDFSLEMTDCHGMNLLHYACKEGIVNLVMDLVEFGADVNGAMTRHCSRYYLFVQILVVM